MTTTSKQTIHLHGNVGMDPKTLVFSNGTKITSFTLGVLTPFKTPTGILNVMVWHDMVIYNPNADIIDTYVKKGDKLSVSAEKVLKQYENEQGDSVVKNVFMVKNFTMLGIIKEGTIPALIQAN